MLYQKAAGKAVQIGLHCRPSSSASSSEDSDAAVTPRGAPRHPSRPWATPPPHRLGLLGVLGAIQAMDERKPLVPSSGLAVQVGTERSIFHASQLGEGLVKELDGPSLDAFVLGRKKGATATKDARYATKYLDTAGTLGISIQDFDDSGTRNGVPRKKKRFSVCLPMSLSIPISGSLQRSRV